MAFPSWTKLTAAVWPNSAAIAKADARTWGLEAETALNALFSPPPIINGYIDLTVSGNVLTISLKRADGSDPSSTNPVYVIVRAQSVAGGGFNVRAITAATTLTVSAGSTLGGEDALRLDLVIVAFDDAGTIRLGVWNGYTSGALYPLPPARVASSTAEGGAGAADSAGVFYTGTAVSSKPWTPLAIATWSTALATAGLYAAAPNRIEGFRPGLRLPGDYPRGHLHGLTLANNSGDANNDIDIAYGVCVSENARDLMALTGTLTKQSDAAWSVGSGAGGMDTGSKSTNQWLYVWLIKRSDTGVVDALFSTSATAPTMPSGYDLKRRIGTVRTDGSSNIRAFVQEGDTFTWSVPINDVSASNPGTSAVARTLTVPPNMTAIFTYWLNNVSTAAVQVLLTETAQADTTPTSTLNDLRTTATSQVVQSEFRRKVDSSSQIRARHQASGASDALVLTTRAFIDSRGRLAA